MTGAKHIFEHPVSGSKYSQEQRKMIDIANFWDGRSCWNYTTDRQLRIGMLESMSVSLTKYVLLTNNDYEITISVIYWCSGQNFYPPPVVKYALPCLHPEYLVSMMVPFQYQMALVDEVIERCVISRKILRHLKITHIELNIKSILRKDTTTNWC